MTIVRNPTSGRGAGLRDWPHIVELLAPFRREWQIEEVQTTPGATTAIAQQAVSSGSEVVVACGGDGTIMQVATALIGSDSTLGLLPLGTGNDLCRTLGLQGDLSKAVAAIFQGREKRIDVGRWRCEGKEGVFLNVAGSGFDAVVAERINEGYRFLRGTTAYLAAVVEKLATYRAAPFRICVDEETCETSVMLCAVANAQSYGGGMRVAPDASLDDGLLDVVIVQGVGRIEFLRTFPKVFSGTHTSHPKVRVLRGREVTIESEWPVPVLADGERIGRTPVSFTLEPSALKILVPQ